MRLILLFLLACTVAATAEIIEIPKSLSPDGEIHGVMDVDRDSRISAEWKEDSFPRIEMTQKTTGQVLTSINYFGAAGDDDRPLREHVRISWRPDSRAFAVTINDRFYSASKVFVMTNESKFVEVPFPSYRAMTGFSAPDNEQLRPRGRSTVEGWDFEGRLIYAIFLSPLPSYSGDDPLVHKVLLRISPAGMIPVKKAEAEQAGKGQSAIRPTPKSENGDKSQPESEGRSQ